MVISRQNQNKRFSSSFRQIRGYCKLGYISATWWIRERLTKQNKFDLNGVSKNCQKVVVITGGTRSIGLEAVKIFLQCNFYVIMGCQKLEEGEMAIKNIKRAGLLGNDHGKINILELELGSLESVRKFASEVKSKTNQIHILVNNAGIMLAPYRLTPDGFESHFQINYLSHFLLINLLLPILINTGTKDEHSRIVNVSSCCHKVTENRIDFEDLQMKKFYSKPLAYGNSKLMQIISSNFLENYFREKQLPVSSYSLHPGIIQSELYKNIIGAMILEPLTKRLLSPMKVGADVIVYTALSPKLENNGSKNLQNFFIALNRRYKTKSLAKDSDIQKKLWEISCKLASIKNEEASLLFTF